jgi:hypothetical protein
MYTSTLAKISVWMDAFPINHLLLIFRHSCYMHACIYAIKLICTANHATMHASMHVTMYTYIHPYIHTYKSTNIHNPTNLGCSRKRALKRSLLLNQRQKRCWRIDSHRCLAMLIYMCVCIYIYMYVCMYGYIFLWGRMRWFVSEFEYIHTWYRRAYMPTPK